MRMTTLALSTVALAALTAAAAAQEQQAGNDASTNAEATFQELIAQCDDTDALMLRARIRLQLGRTTEEAGKEGQALLDKGLAECGQGDLETAKATLEESLAVASAGVEQALAENAAAREAAAAEAEAAEEEANSQRAWWQLW